ncbi:UNC93-like protein 3 [Punica granatum]|uniref:UNC93-like protein 3 n=1 Tax=Punica granatum TaxID=22663 RepID=A0A6P8DPS1_PUNGR|nr:UNC93-like protein 3 [Punica granatum]
MEGGSAAMDSVVSPDEEAPLVATRLPNQAPRKHTRDVHILSCGFLLIFLAYGAAQNLETSVNTTGNLGTISLGILYVSFTIFSLGASLVVRALGSKNAVLLGTTGYWLFIAANLRPSWYTMIPASLYLGFASSIIWVGEGTYLTSTAWSHAKDSNLHEGTVIGSFNGEFWGFFASHQLVGNLISLAILQDDGSGTTSGTNLLFTVFLCSMTLGTILLCFLRKRDDKEGTASEDPSFSLYSYLKCQTNLVISPLFDIRMLLIIPLIAYSGLQQAYVWAEFTKEVVKPALGVRGVGGSMAVYGAFDAICSLAAGRLTSGLTSITWIVSGGAVLQGCVFLALLVRHSYSGVYTYVFPLLLASLLGIGDGVLNTQLNALIALLFKQNTEAAFAQLKVWQCGAIAAVFFLSPYISLQAMLVTMLAAVCVSFFTFLFLTLHVEKAFSHSA